MAFLPLKHVIHYRMVSKMFRDSSNPYIQNFLDDVRQLISSIETLSGAIPPEAQDHLIQYYAAVKNSEKDRVYKQITIYIDHALKKQKETLFNQIALFSSTPSKHTKSDICCSLTENPLLLESSRHGRPIIFMADNDLEKKEDIFKLMLDKGADVDARNQDGQTLLIWAVLMNKLNLCQWLLTKGADIDVRDNSGYTALIKTAEEGHYHICKLLLEEKADPTIRDNQGQIALQWAKKRSYSDIITLLENASPPSLLYRSHINCCTIL